MSHHPSLEFSINRQNNTITVKREFAAELPLVWDAYTKSEILDQWWAPRPWKARTKSMDFREGGIWHYAMVGPAGEEHWAVVEYQTILPRQKFSGLDAFADSNGNINREMPQSKWEIRFTDKGPVTLVEIFISYDDLAQLETTLQMGFQEGLGLAMVGLDEWLAARR